MDGSQLVADLDPARPLYVISDIHSNLPALTTVLGAMETSARVLCAGDIVGYYIDPNPVIELLRSHHVECILGNHDQYVLGLLPYPPSREDKYRAQWTRSALTSENTVWLKNLPQVRTYCVAASGLVDLRSGPSFHRVLLNHGSFSSPEEYIYPDTPFDGSVLGEHTVGIFGHTHHPMVREYGTSRLLNPGSVGQPRDRKASASYARIDLVTGSIELLRENYDVAGYQERLKAAGITPSMVEILARTV